MTLNCVEILKNLPGPQTEVQENLKKWYANICQYPALRWFDLSEPSKQWFDNFQTLYAAQPGPDETCSICRENVNEKKDTDESGNEVNLGDPIPCPVNPQHFFHQACIDGWLGGHPTCPNCKKNWVQSDVVGVPQSVKDDVLSFQLKYNFLRPKTEKTNKKLEKMGANRFNILLTISAWLLTICGYLIRAYSDPSLRIPKIVYICALSGATMAILYIIVCLSGFSTRSRISIPSIALVRNLQLYEKQLEILSTYLYVVSIAAVSVLPSTEKTALAVAGISIVFLLMSSITSVDICITLSLSIVFRFQQEQLTSRTTREITNATYIKAIIVLLMMLSVRAISKPEEKRNTLPVILLDWVVLIIGFSFAGIVVASVKGNVAVRVFAILLLISNSAESLRYAYHWKTWKPSDEPLKFYIR